MAQTRLSKFVSQLSYQPSSNIIPRATNAKSQEYEKIAFKMYLKDGQQTEYKKRHDLIPSEWPELSQELKDAGIFDYSIFFDDDTNLLFAVLKRNKNHTMDNLPQKQIVQKWWKFMSTIMRTDPESPFGQPITKDLSLVFHMD